MLTFTTGDHHITKGLFTATSIIQFIMSIYGEKITTQYKKTKAV